jgi:Uncharacterized alpha/beta hydrolase domain (DUF2235)
VGLPGLLSRSISSSAALHDKRIRHLRQALALHEHRHTFLPRAGDDMHYTGGHGPDGRTMVQRWFAGSHSDVGGGYPQLQAGLAQRSFQWLLQEAAPHLEVDPHTVPAPSKPRLRHDTLFSTPWWALAGMTLRDTRVRNEDGSVTQITPDPQADPGISPWLQRRPLTPVVLSLLFAALLLLLQGRELLAQPQALWQPALWWPAAQAAAAFAQQQAASLWLHGLLASPPWPHSGAVAWAMLFDLGFVACWGYLLARISSRAFAWAAQTQQPGAALPRWLWLGMAPLLAVAGDVGENLLTLAALSLNDLGADTAASLALWAVGLAAAAKWLGLLACVPWLLLRLVLVVLPKR